MPAPTTVTLYTVTGLKRVELGAGASRLYVSIDGGMSDNIRPALYEAAYTALVANRRPDPQAGLVRSRVVGKHCESGDVVVRDVDLPTDLAVGDVLAVPPQRLRALHGLQLQPLHSPRCSLGA